MSHTPWHIGIDTGLICFSIQYAYGTLQARVQRKPYRCSTYTPDIVSFICSFIWTKCFPHKNIDAKTRRIFYHHAAFGFTNQFIIKFAYQFYNLFSIIIFLPLLLLICWTIQRNHFSEALINCLSFITLLMHAKSFLFQRY